MTGDLVLVRHAPTRLEEGVPSAAWELAPGARELTSQLAVRLAALRLAAPGAGALGGIDAVVTSHEPKAVGTGRVLAAELGVPASTAPDLEEHHRAGRRLMDEAEWQRTLKRFFANPDVLLFGTETGAEARARFERGVRAALAERPGKRLALVSHATVMTLLLAGPNGLDPYELWRTVRMPEAFVVRADDLRIVERVALPD